MRTQGPGQALSKPGPHMHPHKEDKCLRVPSIQALWSLEQGKAEVYRDLCQAAVSTAAKQNLPGTTPFPAPCALTPAPVLKILRPISSEPTLTTKDIKAQRAEAMRNKNPEARYGGVCL